MYEDLSRPPLDESSLRRGITEGARATWSRLDVVAETGSTNADLVARIQELSDPSQADRSVLIAEFQSRGRGRHLRAWSSPARAQIAMSAVIANPGVDTALLGWLPLLTGVAVVDALRAVAEVDAKLKWPNDVLLDGKKLVGILAEVAVTDPAPVVVVGLGMNVSLREDELPVPTATSLTLAGAANTDRDTLVRAVLRQWASVVERWHDEVRNGAGDTIAQLYRERCATLGQPVRVMMPGDRELLGTARDVDREGRLVIEPDAGGEPVAVSAGDVTHLRPQG